MKLITQKEIKQALNDKNQWSRGIGSDYQNKVCAVRKVHNAMEEQKLRIDHSTIQRMIERIVNYVLSYEDVLENGQIHIYLSDERITHTFNDQWKPGATYVNTFKIANESKPYSAKSILYQFAL